MIKTIFDTTIFFRMVQDKNLSPIELNEFSSKISEDENFKVFGVDVIRREIKNTASNDRNLLKALLGIYELVKYKEYSTDQRIENLAEQYYNFYRKLGGTKSYRDLKTDLLIVATATIKNMDIVVSADRETMDAEHKYGEKFRKAYREINIKEGFRNPDFWDYLDLKKKFGFFKKQL